MPELRTGAVVNERDYYLEIQRAILVKDDGTHAHTTASWLADAYELTYAQVCADIVVIATRRNDGRSILTVEPELAFHLGTLTLEP